MRGPRKHRPCRTWITNPTRRGEPAASIRDAPALPAASLAQPPALHGRSQCKFNTTQKPPECNDLCGPTRQKLESSFGKYGLSQQEVNRTIVVPPFCKLFPWVQDLRSTTPLVLSRGSNRQ